MTTYYVRQSGGSDGNAGTSFALGWATIQHAADTAVAGDTVLICADGTHAPTATIDFDTNAGTDRNPILFKGAASDGTDDGTRVTIDGSGITSAPTFKLTTAVDRLVFDGIRITGATDSAIADGPSDQANSIHLRNCRFDNAANHGVELYGTYSVFENIECDNNGGSGISTESQTSRLGSSFIYRSSFHHNTSHGLHYGPGTSTILRCLFYRNGGDGLSIQREMENVSILQNIFHANTGDGIGVQSSETITNHPGTVIGNVFTDNGAYGVSFYADDHHFPGSVDYNLYGTGDMANTSGARQNFPTGDNDLSGDPLFTSTTNGAEDFTPATGSPQIDAGTTVPTS